MTKSKQESRLGQYTIRGIVMPIYPTFPPKSHDDIVRYHWPCGTCLATNTKCSLTGKEGFDGAAGPSIPFGLGPRDCFGRKLAYVELKLVLTLLVWSFGFLPCPPQFPSYEGVEALTRKPAQCFVKLQPVNTWCSTSSFKQGWSKKRRLTLTVASLCSTNNNVSEPHVFQGFIQFWSFRSSTAP